MHENSEKLYELFGAVLGKVLFEKITIETHFDYTFLRQLLRPFCESHISLDDVKNFDFEMSQSWKQILECE